MQALVEVEMAASEAVCWVLFSLQGSALKNPTSVTNFVDDEGTKCVKRMITLFIITGQFIPQNRRQSKRLSKQMLNSYRWSTYVNSVFSIFSRFYIAPK